MDSMLAFNNSPDEFDIQAMFSPYTVFSLLPFPIPTTKPGIRPFEFLVPPRIDGVPGALVIKNTFRSQQFLTAAGPAEQSWVPEYPMVVANSIVNDYSSAQLIFDAIKHRPGIFALPGVLNADDLINHTDLVREVTKRHDAWCMELVKLADNDWARDHNRSSISDLQVMAAKEQKLDREWVINSAKLINTACPACTNYVPKEAAICPKCRCILDPLKAASLVFAKESN